MISIPNPVEGAALARPDGLALVSPAGQSTWRQLRDEARALAQTWRGRVASGDVVALATRNDAAFVRAFHALGMLGAAVAPVPASEAERSRLCAAVGASVYLDPSEAAASQPGPCPHAEAPDWPLDAIRAVVCTSGTSGAPTPVAVTTAQMVFSAFGSALRLGHLSDDRWLLCLPLNAIGGLSILMRAVFAATTVELLPRFDAEVAADALSSGRCTLFSFVPTMLHDTLRALGSRPVSPRVRAVLVGGAPCPAALLERARAVGVPVALTWGMTETASQICTWSPGDFETVGAGPPLAFARVHADSNNRLVVRGPTALRGEHRTSDAGHVGAEGCVVVEGRVDDLVNSGGVKISPAEVEGVLSSQPSVAEVAVLGVPDARLGARLVAYVVASGPTDPDTLRAFCEVHLPRARCPREILLLDELPRGPTGKVDRRALAARADRLDSPPEMEHF